MVLKGEGPTAEEVVSAKDFEFSEEMIEPKPASLGGSLLSICSPSAQGEASGLQEY